MNELESSDWSIKIKSNPQIDWFVISRRGDLSKAFLTEYQECLHWDDVLLHQNVDEDIAKTIVPTQCYDSLIGQEAFNTYSKEFQLLVVKTAIDSIWIDPEYWMQYLSDEMKIEAERLLNIIKDQYSNDIEAYCKSVKV